MSQATPKEKKARTAPRPGRVVKQGKATLEKLNAIHEAGHFVMAELLSLDPEYVTIESAGMSHGHLRRRNSAFTASEKWHELLVNCAGVIAEGIYSPKVSSRRKLGLGISVEGADGKHLLDALTAHSANPQQLSDWYELVYSQTEEILNNRAVWRAVMALADRLLAERKIYSGEAFPTIRAGLGRSKWARDQYQMAERYASPPSDWIDSREEYRQIEALLRTARAEFALDCAGQLSKLADLQQTRAQIKNDDADRN